MTRKELEIFNDMPFFFWVKDEEGRYVWVNKALSEMADNDIIGKTDKELPWVRDAEALRANDQIVMQTGLPLYVNEVAHNPDEINLSVCKFVGDFEGKKCSFGVSFMIGG